MEKGRPGFKLEKLEHKLGVRAIDTGTYVLDDCRIPKDNILGSAEVKQSTEGFKGAMKTFDNTRPLVASMALGVSRAALDLTKEKIEESGIKLDYEKNPNNVSSMEKEFYLMEANQEAMPAADLARRMDDGQRRVQQPGSVDGEGQIGPIRNPNRSEMLRATRPPGSVVRKSRRESGCGTSRSRISSRARGRYSI